VWGGGWGGGRGGGGKGGSGKKVVYSCVWCGVETKGEAERCPTCDKHMGKCSVCRIPVSGAYVWCQGCGHGGHLEHMQSWFSKYDVCPSGCGHKCAASLSSSDRDY